LRTSIAQITTVTQSFAHDLDAYRAAGADGIGIWEMKLADDSLERFRASGLEAGAAVPLVPSILPLPLMEGPDDPADRIEALCASVERLAPFEPACVLFLTGPGDLGAILEGVRQVADAAARVGVPLALEPIQPNFAHFWSIVSTLDDAAALLDMAGRPEVGLVFDTWHLWNAPALRDEIARHRERILALHVADWREPTRNTNDRVLPGEGVIDFGPIFAALEWDGLFDLEIFSDAELEGSLWRRHPRELARRGVEALRSVSA
jgi:sugar phosphate isomerase/epimerase